MRNEASDYKRLLRDARIFVQKEAEQKANEYRSLVAEARKSVAVPGRQKERNMVYSSSAPQLLLEHDKKRVPDECIRRRGPCPPLLPGQLPFYHDPVTLRKHYEKIWKGHPTPAEQPHTQLRWETRQLML